MSRALLITGATGKQGGAVVRALAAKADFQILAVTRDLSSQSAQRLAKFPNIKLVTGNLDDCGEIFKAAKTVSDEPIWGVYSVQVRTAGVLYCSRLANVSRSPPSTVKVPLLKRSREKH